jgi:hypothetical protein
MEIEIMILSEISQAQKDKIACFCSYAESRPKKIVMWHDWTGDYCVGGETAGQKIGRELWAMNVFEVHYMYVYMYENSTMKLTKYCSKGGGPGRVARKE